MDDHQNNVYENVDEVSCSLVELLLRAVMSQNVFCLKNIKKWSNLPYLAITLIWKFSL